MCARVYICQRRCRCTACIHQAASVYLHKDAHLNQPHSNNMTAYKNERSQRGVELFKDKRNNGKETTHKQTKQKLILIGADLWIIKQQGLENPAKPLSINAVCCCINKCKHAKSHTHLLPVWAHLRWAEALWTTFSGSFSGNRGRIIFWPKGGNGAICNGINPQFKSQSSWWYDSALVHRARQHMLTTKQQRKPQTVEKSKSNIKREREDILFSKLTAVGILSSPMHTECCKEESWCNTVENMLFETCFWHLI